MKNMIKAAGFAVLALSGSVAPAAAHHVMDGKLPTTVTEGLLSGLGHPVIGLDHLAAVIAVGCLAALHRSGAMLAAGYVLALMIGAALHIRGTNIPAAELLVALSVLLLGATMIWRQPGHAGIVAGLFALTGLLHGYALGESIVGAEPAPLGSYFVGLAVVQMLIALAVLRLARFIAKPGLPMPSLLRAAGAAIALVGLIGLVGQLLPGV